MTTHYKLLVSNGNYPDSVMTVDDLVEGKALQDVMSRIGVVSVVFAAAPGFEKGVHRALLDQTAFTHIH